MTTTPMRSISVEALLAARDQFVRIINRAGEELREAREALARFDVDAPPVSLVFPGGEHRTLHDGRNADDIQQEVDRRVWVALLKGTNADVLMDAKTRQDWWNDLMNPRHYMRRNPVPVLNAENIEATLQGIQESLPEFFEKSVEAVFRGLSWNHKTNSPYRMKRRLILEYAFQPWPRSMQTNQVCPMPCGRLEDLERVLCLCLKRTPPANGVGVRSLGYIPYGQWATVGAPDGGTPILRVKPFRNGNLHVEILESEGVDEMNRIISKMHSMELAEEPRK